jgi:transcriptional regulator with XRE-family HTH domain
MSRKPHINAVLIPPSGIGFRVRMLRQMRGLKRWQVAVDAKVSDGWMSHLEQGHIISPDPHKLERLAVALGTSYEDLMAAAGYTAVRNVPDDVVEFFHALMALTDNDRTRLLDMLRVYTKPQIPQATTPKWVS